MTPARPAPPEGRTYTLALDKRGKWRKRYLAPPRATEQATVRAILDYLALKGIFAWRQNSRVVMLPGREGKQRPYRMGGMKGMADIIGCVRHPCPVRECHYEDHKIGRLLAIEVKSAIGKPTPEQVAFLAAVVKAGGIAFIAKSLDDVRAHGL